MKCPVCHKKYTKCRKHKKYKMHKDCMKKHRGGFENQPIPIVRTLAFNDVGDDNELYSASFSPDGLKILTVNSNTINMRSANGLKIWGFHTTGETSALFSPDGAQILTGGIDSVVQLLDANTGEKHLTLRIGEPSFSPNGSKIVIWSGFIAYVYDKNGSMIYTLEGHTGNMWGTPHFSPDESKIITYSGDNTARVWNADTGEIIRILEGHGNIVHYADFSPDGTTIITASFDKSMRVWDANTYALMYVRNEFDKRVKPSFSQDGSKIVFVTDKNQSTIRDVGTGKIMNTIRIKGYTGYVNFAKFSPNGQVILTSTYDKIHLWTSNGSLIKTIPFSGGVHTTQFSSDGFKLIITGDNGDVHVWEQDQKSVDAHKSGMIDALNKSVGLNNDVLSEEHAGSIIKQYL